MYWVKLTRVYDQHTIYINLDRFDRIEVLNDKDDKQITVISATLSATEEDAVEIEVAEAPEEFIPVMES